MIIIINKEVFWNIAGHRGKVIKAKFPVIFVCYFLFLASPKCYMLLLFESGDCCYSKEYQKSNQEEGTERN